MSVMTVCAEPIATDGYIIDQDGGQNLGDSRLVECAEGFMGTPSEITCEDDGYWSLPSGCTKL